MRTIPGIDRRYRQLGRYRQIIEVLLRHGFGYLVEQVDLGHLAPLRRRVLSAPETGVATLGSRLRAVCEELGPAYIKLGQLLSTRADLFPPDVVAELTKLQDNVPPFSSAQAITFIEQETGKSISACFSEFDHEPIAAASIGQVHRAVLPDGTEVVVKVQRPGVIQTVNTDLDILFSLARRAQERLKPTVVNLVDFVEEFARSIRRELDYTVEGRSIERFRRNSRHDINVHIPQVYWHLTTGRVLVLEFVHGKKLNELLLEGVGGVSREELARRLAQAFLKQVMIDGYFHADPHPGNVLVEPDGRIAFIDFGMVGHLGQSTMESLAALFVSLVRRDIEGTVAAMTDIGVINPHQDLHRLKRDMDELVDKHYGQSLREMRFAEIMTEITQLAYRYHIQLPHDFLLLGKALLTIEGVGRSLNPNFNAVEIAEPFARQLVRRRLDPRRLASKGSEGLRSYSRMLVRIPARLATVLSLMERGELAVQFRHVGLEQLISRLDVISNRLSVALVVAALIIGSSLILSLAQGPRLFNMPLFGVVGFVIAAFTGIWLVIAVLRSGRL